jgi:hypothetical protein
MIGAHGLIMVLRIVFIVVTPCVERRMLLLHAAGGSRFQCWTMPPRREARATSDAAQAAGFSLPGAVHSAPFMKESFGVSATWLV